VVAGQRKSLFFKVQLHLELQALEVLAMRQLDQVAELLLLQILFQQVAAVLLVATQLLVVLRQQVVLVV
jgi:hypothetical protein